MTNSKNATKEGRLPVISIVTPSFNQARFLGETLQSLVDQGYPHLEVIIQEGGSTDGALEVARAFSAAHPDIFQLHVEKDEGQADALNRGFKRTRGEILGFLNSDDTLLPGVLHRVAAEIDPRRRRFVVMGRCMFTGEASAYVGAEHPSVFVSHFDQLAIWKRRFNTIPQPAVFWHRSVWERDGGFDVNDHHVLDYDLFCRFSRHYRFHKIDEFWSTYRMHAVSKSSQRSEAEVLDLSIATSRRYWGSWLSPLRWRCEVSLWLHDRHIHEHARHHARRAEEAAAAGKNWTAFVETWRTFFYSPVMARDRLWAAKATRWHLGLLTLLFRSQGGFHGRYADGWIGPYYREEVVVPQNGARFAVILQHIPQGPHQKVNVRLRINRKRLAAISLAEGRQFSLSADVSGHRNRNVVVEIECDAYFVPALIHNNSDDRHLSLQLHESRIVST